MSKILKIIVGVIAIVIVAVIIIVSKGNVSKNVNPIKIGVILPLSGDLAFIGESAKQGAELALSNFVNTKHKYELVFEDDQFSAEKAVTAANKLISVDKVDAIISFGSSAGNVIKPLATNNKIIQFAVASDPTIADGIYNFNHWTPPSEEVHTMVAELQKRGITKITILTVNQDGMLTIANELKKQIQGTNIQVVNDQTFNIGEKDFRSVILKLKQNLPQIIVMANYTPELEILGKQIKDSGINIPMTSFEGFDQTTKPELFNGYWYASASDPTSEFSSTFKSKNNKDPVIGTGNVYDIVSLFITSSEKSNLTNPIPDDIAHQLHNVQNYKGAMGSLTINNNGAVLSTATIKTVQVKK